MFVLGPLLNHNVAAMGGTAGPAATIWATNADYTLSNGSLTALRSGTGTFWGIEHASAAKANGNVIFNIDAVGSSTQRFVGFDDGSETANLGNSGAGDSIGWESGGGVIFTGGTVATISSWTTGDKLEIDKAGAVFSFYKWSGGVKGSALATIDTSTGFGVGTVMAGNCYPSLTSNNNTGFQVTADFTGF